MPPHLISTLRLLLSRLAKSSNHSNQHRTIDSSDYLESIQEPDEFSSVLRDSRTTSPSLCNSSITAHSSSCSRQFAASASEHTLKCLLKQRSSSVKRLPWEEPFVRSGSAGQPAAVNRHSIDSRSTAVDDHSAASCVSAEHQLKVRASTQQQYRSLSPLSDDHPIYSQPPSMPPPTCPLPSIPPLHHVSPVPSPAFSANNPSFIPLHSRASPAVYLAPPRPSFPQLTSPASLHQAHPCTSYRQALQPIRDSFYDDDPFAAEKIVVTGGGNRQVPGSRWSDDESVDPLGPARRSSTSNSVYTAASESCYSVNTTINSRVLPASCMGYVYRGTPAPQRPPASITTSGESQEDAITSSHCAEEETLSQIEMPRVDRLTINSPELPASRDYLFSPSRPPLAETFSFGLPSRFDGFFFGYHRRPDQSHNTAPAMILKVSPPISSTILSPGESIHFKISLEHLFEQVIVSFVGESRLIGQHHKIKSHRFLKHEIDLNSQGQWGCWDIQRGDDPKEWFVHLKIPSVINCHCKEKLSKNHFGDLELPSSTINNQVFIAYHLIIRGIGKQKKADKTKKIRKRFPHISSSSSSSSSHKSKSEERVRLTVMVKKNKHIVKPPAKSKRSDEVTSNDIEKGWVVDQHNYSCVSIE